MARAKANGGGTDTGAPTTASLCKGERAPAVTVNDDQRVDQIESARAGDVVTVTSLRQASAIAYRWSITFSRLYAWWRPAGLLALPFMWLTNLTLIGLHASDVVHWRAAAMQAPNPATRRPRRLWSAILLLPVVLVTVMLLVSVSTQAPAIVYRLGTATILCCAAATAAEAFISARIQHAGGGLKQTEHLLRHESEGPVVTGALFGAWPRGTGAGSHLLGEVLNEQRAAGVTMLVLARDEDTANWYVDQHKGVRVSPDHPLHIAWGSRLASTAL